MSLSHTLSRALNVEPGEGHPLVLLLVHSFFMGIAIVSYFAASTALFLTEFGSKSLPYVYIASAVISTLIGAVYARFEKKLPIQKLLVGTLSFLLLSVSVFRIGIQLTDARWPAFCLMAWYTVLHALLSVEFWGLASRLFDVRQGKRLFGLLGAGEMIASVTGGLLTPLFIRYFGTPNLLLVSATGLGFCLLILGEIIRHFGGHLERARDPGETGNVRHIRYRDLLKNQYIRLLLLLYLLAVAVVYFVDFNFLDQAKVRYQNQDELARFFGLFYGIAQAVTLILITFVTGRLISRYGVRTGMRVRPVILTVCTLALVLNASGLGPVGLVFWLAATTKLFDLVLHRVASAPAFQVLYQPIRPAPRLAAQLSAESMVGPIAGGLVGATLLLVQWLDISSGLVLGTATLLVLVAWMKTGARTYRQYRHALAEALRKRRLEGSALSLNDETTQDILTSRLKSAHPGEVMYAISLLERLEHKDLPAFLIDLLDHPASEVRQDALARIQNVEFAVAFSAVRSRIEHDKDPQVRAEALKALCALGEAEVVDYVTPYLEHSDPEVCLGATVGLLRNGGIDGVLMAGNRLLETSSSTLPAERIFVARTLSEVGIRSFYRPLLGLLQDDDPGVRKAALVAAAEIRSPRLWPLVLENLALHKYHVPAASALAAGGDAALSSLGAAFSRTDASRQVQIRIAGICGRIRGDRAVSLLKSWLDFPDKGVRTEVFQSLRLCEYRAQGGDVVDVRRLLREEAADAAWLLRIWMDLGTEDSVSLLRGTLLQELEQIRTRCFFLLSFLYDATLVLRTRENLRRENGEQRAYALEVLETTLSRDLVTLLFPLFERLSPAICLQQMNLLFPQQARSRPDRLIELMSSNNGQNNPWIRTCAMHAAAMLSLTTCAKSVQENLRSTDALVRETAAWSLSLLDRSAFEQQRHTLENSDDERVLKIIPPIGQSSEGDRPMLLTIEKVMVLKSVSIFSRVPDEVLASLASVMEEVEAQEGEAIYKKGEMGQTLYIIADGRVRVHDGDRTFVVLGERDFFGELTTLDPEPNLATVTPLEETRLLGLDRDALYELMSDHTEVLRAIIHVLCQRLRGKNENDRW